MQKVLIPIVFILISFQGFAQKKLQAVKTNIAVSIDGKIDSVLHILPNSATGFIQMEPMPGSPSVQNTVVFVLYDENTLYVAFKCYQDPASIRAKIQSRDKLSKSDDIV
jgi:hypothetical protein